MFDFLFYKYTVIELFGDIFQIWIAYFLPCLCFTFIVLYFTCNPHLSEKPSKCWCSVKIKCHLLDLNVNYLFMFAVCFLCVGLSVCLSFSLSLYLWIFSSVAACLFVVLNLRMKLCNLTQNDWGHATAKLFLCKHAYIQKLALYWQDSQTGCKTVQEKYGSIIRIIRGIFIRQVPYVTSPRITTYKACMHALLLSRTRINCGLMSQVSFRTIIYGNYNLRCNACPCTICL